LPTPPGHLWAAPYGGLNLDKTSPDRWVIEPQLNVLLDDRFQAVAEFRFNEYEDANPRLDGAGLALGVAVAFAGAMSD
jgi:hypothetical protein